MVRPYAPLPFFASSAWPLCTAMGREYLPNAPLLQPADIFHYGVPYFAPYFHASF